jgi:hypothetical protein
MGKSFWCDIMIKKVCHFTSVHPANDIRIYHKECKSLAHNNFEVHLVAIDMLPKSEQNIFFHAVPSQKEKNRLSRIIFRAWKTYKIAKEVNADIYHFHDPELLPYGLVLKWQGKKVIYDAHEDVPRDIMMKSWIPLFLRKPISWAIEKTENFVARRLDKVVTATPYIGKRFENIGANVVIINNFPRLDELTFDQNKNAIKNATPTICYVGLISAERGIIEMLDAIKNLDVKFILAGKFNNQKIEEQAKSHPSWKKVEYYPHLSRNEIAEVFAKSSLGLCLLHPKETYIHSLPIKLFEYMSGGIPVLASNFPLWKDIIESSKSGICADPYNIKEIEQGIQKIIDIPELMTFMGNNGKETVQNKFNWQTEEEKLIKAYNQLTKK